LVPYVLGAAWGVLVAAPLAWRAHRRFQTRVHALAPAPVARSRRTRRWRAALAAGLGRSRVGHLMGDTVRRRRVRRHDARIRREVPVTVDLLAVAVGAGCTPYGAVEVAAHWAPPEVAALLGAVPRACALGSSLGAALGQLADGAPALRPLAEALEASDRLGSPIGPALATLASEERAALRRRAETHARTVPVRLLFPLVFLVLPAFGLLTVVPAVLAGFSRT
jgi:tight adherence protein C